MTDADLDALRRIIYRKDGKIYSSVAGIIASNLFREVAALRSQVEEAERAGNDQRREIVRLTADLWEANHNRDVARDMWEAIIQEKQEVSERLAASEAAFERVRDAVENSPHGPVRLSDALRELVDVAPSAALAEDRARVAEHCAQIVEEDRGYTAKVIRDDRHERAARILKAYPTHE